ncbi:MAG TPA: hypothetical protein VK539_16720 [Myxococcaceae bacterium]|nr:hypothetical protein [Myxococcaceae bacterium]
MPSNLFFVRLVANRLDFAMAMPPEEQVTMGAHGEFLQSQLAVVTLVGRAR